MKNTLTAYSRTVVFAAVMIAVCTTLSGCGVFTLNKYSGDGDDSSVTSSDSETTFRDFQPYQGDYESEINSFFSYIQGISYGGGACKIVTAGKNVLSPDEATSVVMSKEYSERNKAVEDNLNISLVCETSDPETMLENIKQSNLSGSYYADIVLLPQSKLYAYAVSGAVANLRSLPSFDYEAPFLYDASVKSGGGGNSVYGVAGPASVEPDSLSGIYFNKSLIEAAGLESPYGLCDRGEWTVDKYIEYARTAATVSGCASFAAQNTSPYLADLFYFAAGGRLTDYRMGQYPTLAIGSEGAAPRIEKAAAAVNMEGAAPAESGIESFSSGGAVFLVERLLVMKTIANSACDWGLLPLPKYDAQQSAYLTLADPASALFFSVPVSAPDYSMTGDVINAMNILSYGYARDAYLTDASYHYLRDNQSIRMMSYIMDNPVYDGAYSFADAGDAVPNATYAALRACAAGVAPVSQYTEAWGLPFENTMYRLFKIE